jgi:hypothetical protein
MQFKKPDKLPDNKTTEGEQEGRIGSTVSLKE